MSRALTVYRLAKENAHEESQTSTGTADIKTFTPPAATVNGMVPVGVILCAVTTNARVNLNGEDPTAETGGVIIVAGAQPVVLPVKPGATVKFVSTAAANSILFLTFVY